MKTHRVINNETVLHFHLDNVHCIGNETALSNCSHNGVGDHDCAVKSEEAGVICNCMCGQYAVHTLITFFHYAASYGNMCNENDVQLINNMVENEGQVQICFNGFWVSVCIYGWYRTEVSVLCGQLGYSQCRFL